MKPGWQTSEAWLTGGAVPAIITLASMATPAHTKVSSIIAVAAVSIVYTAARTWLKSTPPTPHQLGQLLEQQYQSRCSVDGGPRTSREPAQKRADLERVSVLILEFLETAQPTEQVMINVLGIAIDPTNLEGSIVTGIDGLIEKQVRAAWPASANLPHLNAAVEANVALATDLMNVYALSKLETLAGQALDAIAKKFPMAAAEVAALKAKIPNL